MRIVTQSTYISYSRLLALPAPKIAGLLPTTVPTVPDYEILPAEEPFSFESLPTPEEFELEFRMIVTRFAQRMAAVRA